MEGATKILAVYRQGDRVNQPLWEMVGWAPIALWTCAAEKSWGFEKWNTFGSEVQWQILIVDRWFQICFYFDIIENWGYWGRWTHFDDNVFWNGVVQPLDGSCKLYIAWNPVCLVYFISKYWCPWHKRESFGVLEWCHTPLQNFISSGGGWKWWSSKYLRSPGEQLQTLKLRFEFCNKFKFFMVLSQIKNGSAAIPILGNL